VATHRQQINIPQLVHGLERRDLEGLTPPTMELWGAMQNVPFIRVLGQSAFWEADPEAGYEQRMEDLVTGFHGQGTTFLYLVWGDGASVRIYVGLQGADAEGLLAPALIGSYPGIELAAEADTNLGRTLQDSGVLAQRGRMTGIPTRKTGRLARPGPSGSSAERRGQERQSQAGAQQIERLLRALGRVQWGYLVRATPLPHQQVILEAYRHLDQIAQVASQSKVQRQVHKQQLRSVDPTTQYSESESLSADVINRRADYAVEQLELQLARLDRAKACGMWQAELHFFAADAATLRKVQALLRGVFAGEDSRPEPVRTFLCGEPGGTPDGFLTKLTTAELATLSQLPRVEFPGYGVSDYARFDVDPIREGSDPPAPEQAINVGKVLDAGQPTGGWFVVARDDLAKHGLVVGVTGSGKTNTLFYLLDKLWAGGRGLPFLAIEPAKAEYRELRGAQGLNDLQVFTLGDETVAPFRLNPFEFEITPTGRIHVQTHIDYLKSVFNAAFILYAPMPYVLETCLHEIYQDKGWDLTTGQNRRLPANLRGREADYPLFPTLTDLYHKIDEVVDRLGYEERIQMDVKAGLKARVGSLRLGGKGLMLDVAHGLSMNKLLARPTVLEMERVGNDDEKAFLIGMVLTRLYEHRVIQAQSGTPLPKLQHVTVFEEAHRLLKNVPTEVETEAANTKGQAVETFANMLSEIRAYGEGVLIAEQIPTKLAPDAIKNTNLKIVHRVVAEDDRLIMGGAMNMDEAQERYVTTLLTGQAAVYAEGADKPYLVAVPPFKGQRTSARPSDAVIRAAMRPVTQSSLYDPAPEYSHYVQRKGNEHFDPEIRDLALKAMEQRGFGEMWAAYTLSLLLDPANAVSGYPGFPALVEQVAGKLAKTMQQQVLTALVLYAAAQTMDARGRAYGWLYNVTETLRGQWVKAMVTIVQGYDKKASTLQALSSLATTQLVPFREGYYQQTKRLRGPFAGCTQCPNRCLYRQEVAVLVQDRAMARDFSSVIQNRERDALWSGLGRVALSAARRLVCPWEEEAEKRGHMVGLERAVGVCYTVQMGEALAFSSSNQHKLVDNVRAVLQQS
jgi:hypothetical protein